MKLSSKSLYGVKAMMDMAINYPDDMTTVKSVAERQNIPEKYLEQIFSILKKAGLLISTRGPHGGYSLALPPEEITIGDILRAMEGELVPVDCVNENNYRLKCKREDICITKYLWTAIRDKMNNIVDKMALDQLAEGYKNNELIDDNMD